MTYQYKSPIDRGLTRTKLSTKDHNYLFPGRKKNWRIRFEYYINEDEFVIEEYCSTIAKIIQVICFPLMVIGVGVFNFKELIDEYKRLFFQKRYGAFVSNTIYRRKRSFDEILQRIQ